MKKKVIISIVSGLILLVLLLSGYGFYKIKITQKIIKPEEAKTKIEKFINDVLLPPNIKVTIKNITQEKNLYNIALEIDGKDYTSYMTLDGKKFFQTGLDIEQTTKEAQDAKTAQTNPESKQPATPLTKTDKPNIELFVMSHCPYGTQIEKGILPVIETLKNKINFSLKFCDYAMHGEKELKEQLVQYCIQKEENNKLNGYLNCFLQTENSTSCLKSTGINEIKNNNCVKSTDEQYQVTKKFNDKNTWVNGNFPPFDVYKNDNTKYSVQGSPSLIINGNNAESGRDSDSLLAIICSAFNEPPAECNKQLSKTTPSAGFGNEATNPTTSNNGGCAQ